MDKDAKDVKLAAKLLNCETSEVERTERDIDGGLRVWYRGTMKYFTPARLAALADSAAETVRERMIVDDDLPVEKKTRGKRA